MSTEVAIKLTVNDSGATAAFQRITSAAKSLAAAFGQAGTQGSAGLGKLDGAAAKSAASLGKVQAEAGQTASGLGKIDAAAARTAAGIGKVDAAASKAEFSFSRFSKAGAMFGAGLGSIVGVMSDFARAAAEEEAIFARLQAAVENTGAAYDDYAERIAGAIKAGEELAFADEQTAEALNRLTTLTGDAGAALDSLAAAQELARGRGIALADAATLIGRAYNGQTASLQRMGISLSETASGMEAVTAVQARFAGQADAYASSTAGAADRVRNAFANLAEGASASADTLQLVLTLLPGISSGISLAGAAAGSAVKGLAGMGSALSPVTAGLTAVATASAGPLVVGLGAAVAAVGLGIKAFQDLQAQSKSVAESIDALEAALAGVESAALRAGFRDLVVSLEEVDFIANELANKPGLGMDRASSFILSVRQETDDFNQALGTTLSTVNEVDGDLNTFAGTVMRLNANVIAGAISMGDAADILRDIGEAMSYAGPNAAFLRDEVSRLLAEFVRTGDVEAFNVALDVLADNEGAAADALAKTAAAAGEARESIASLHEFEVNRLRTMQESMQAEKAVADQRQAEIDETMTKLGLEGQAARLNAQAVAYLGEQAGFTAEQQARFAELVAQGTPILEAQQQVIDESAAAAAELASTLAGALVPALAGTAGGFAAAVRPGEDVLDVLSRIVPANDAAANSFVLLTDGLNDAAQAMDGALSVFSQIDALGQRMEAAGSIAEALVGDPGVWATIDDMLVSGRISLEEYNRAVEAGYSIQSNAVLVEADLNEIRAQQIPLLAAQSDRYAAYIAQLSEASTVEQQHALYLMDSANQAQVAAAYSTAYAASLGEIPTNVATEIIASAAQADPILADVLDRMGLIEIGANGEVRINFPDTATLDDAVTAIDRLNNTLVQVGIAITGKDELSALTVDMDKVDGRTVAGTVLVNDAASETLGVVEGRLLTIDGTTATATVDVVFTDSAQARASEIADAYGGGGGQAVTIAVTADTSAATRAIGQVTGATYEAALLVNEQEALDSIAAATAAGTTFDAAIYGATAIVNEQDALDSLAAATAAGTTFDAAIYGATAIVNEQEALDSIAAATAAGTTFGDTTFEASVTANEDEAMNSIAAVKATGDLYATTYTATLTAVDSASGTIESVRAALVNLDGQVATVYVDVVERGGSVPARALGGGVWQDGPALHLAQIPRAAMGRVVMVGEAGPEAVVLPYGSMVVPNGAAQARAAAEGGSDLTPRVNLAEAYRRGSDSAAAFFRGLLDEVRQRQDDLDRELNDTIYGSRDEAIAALREYEELERAEERLQKKKRRGREYDRERRREEEKGTEEAIDGVEELGKRADRLPKKGEESGRALGDKFGRSLKRSRALAELGTIDEAIASLAGKAVMTTVDADVEPFKGKIAVADLAGTEFGTKRWAAFLDANKDGFITERDKAVYEGDLFKLKRWDAAFGALLDQSLDLEKTDAGLGAAYNRAKLFERGGGGQDGMYEAQIGSRKSDQYDATFEKIITDICNLMGSRAPEYFNCGSRGVTPPPGSDPNRSPVNVEVDMERVGKNLAEYLPGGGGGGDPPKGKRCKTKADCGQGMVCENGRCVSGTGSGGGKCSPNCGYGDKCNKNKDCTSGCCKGGRCGGPGQCPAETAPPPETQERAALPPPFDAGYSPPVLPMPPSGPDLLAPGVPAAATVQPIAQAIAGAIERVFERRDRDRDGRERIGTGEAGGVRIYGNVTVAPQTAGLQREIERQLTSRRF